MENIVDDKSVAENVVEGKRKRGRPSGKGGQLTKMVFFRTTDESIQALVKSTGLPVAASCRKAIDEYVRTHPAN